MSSGSKAILGDLCAHYNKWCNKAAQNISFSKFTSTIKSKFPLSTLGSHSINCPLNEKTVQISMVFLKQNKIIKLFIWSVCRHCRSRPSLCHCSSWEPWSVRSGADYTSVSFSWVRSGVADDIGSDVNCIDMHGGRTNNSWSSNFHCDWTCCYCMPFVCGKYENITGQYAVW